MKVIDVQNVYLKYRPQRKILFGESVLTSSKVKSLVFWDPLGLVKVPCKNIDRNPP